MPGHYRESQQIANNQIPNALERIKTVLETARTLGKTQPKPEIVTKISVAKPTVADVKTATAVPIPA